MSAEPSSLTVENGAVALEQDLVALDEEVAGLKKEDLKSRIRIANDVLAARNQQRRWSLAGNVPELVERVKDILRGREPPPPPARERPQNACSAAPSGNAQKVVLASVDAGLLTDDQFYARWLDGQLETSINFLADEVLRISKSPSAVDVFEVVFHKMGRNLVGQIRHCTNDNLREKGYEPADENEFDVFLYVCFALCATNGELSLRFELIQPGVRGAMKLERFKEIQKCLSCITTTGASRTWNTPHALSDDITAVEHILNHDLKRWMPQGIALTMDDDVGSTRSERIKNSGKTWSSSGRKADGSVRKADGSVRDSICNPSVGLCLGVRSRVTGAGVHEQKLSFAESFAGKLAPSMAESGMLVMDRGYANMTLTAELLMLGVHCLGVLQETATTGVGFEVVPSSILGPGSHGQQSSNNIPANANQSVPAFGPLKIDGQDCYVVLTNGVDYGLPYDPRFGDRTITVLERVPSHKGTSFRAIILVSERTAFQNKGKKQYARFACSFERLEDAAELQNNFVIIPRKLSNEQEFVFTSASFKSDKRREPHFEAWRSCMSPHCRAITVCDGDPVWYVSREFFITETLACVLLSFFYSRGNCRHLDGLLGQNFDAMECVESTTREDLARAEALESSDRA